MKTVVGVLVVVVIVEEVAVPVVGVELGDPIAVVADADKLVVDKEENELGV